MVNTYPIAQNSVSTLVFSHAPRVVIIEARYYTDLADMLLTGAKNTLDTINASYEVLTVTGALELPLALSLASQKKSFDAAVILGAIIRGDTTHYETVCDESNRGIMDISLRYNMPIGNAILTVENMAQAIERADPNRMNKGGSAAEAALTMLSIKQSYGIL
jgi:6,7-dimethyl-8-ribityllumazine synthase